MFAALPMYDRPENATAHDALWAVVRDGLRARGVAAPDALDRAVPYDEGWGRPDLVLGQICSLPFRVQFKGRVTVLGASDYGLPGAGPGEYYSVVVARPGPGDALHGDRLAYNDALSNSGWWAALGWAEAEGRRVRPALRTGSHARSLAAVAEGRADLAAIDAVTWRALERWDPRARDVRVVGRTPASPGMTFVTRAGEDPAPYRAALAEGVAALEAADREVLGLRGVVELAPDAYDLGIPPDPAADPG